VPPCTWISSPPLPKLFLGTGSSSSRLGPFFLPRTGIRRFPFPRNFDVFVSSPRTPLYNDVARFLFLAFVIFFLFLPDMRLVADPSADIEPLSGCRNGIQIFRGHISYVFFPSLPFLPTEKSGLFPPEKSLFFPSFFISHAAPLNAV